MENEEIRFKIKDVKKYEEYSKLITEYQKAKIDHVKWFGSVALLSTILLYNSIAFGPAPYTMALGGLLGSFSVLGFGEVLDAQKKINRWKDLKNSLIENNELEEKNNIRGGR